jgi:hypothetical protein
VPGEIYATKDANHMSLLKPYNSEVVFSGPPASYTAANAASVAAQSLVATGTGDYQQPMFPGGFWLEGRTDQLVSFEFCATMTGQASATTATFIAGLAAGSQAGSGGSALLTYPALTITSYAAGTIYGSGIIQCRGAGYGTSSVSTSLLSSGLILGTGNALQVTGCAGPTALQTIDRTSNQWFYLTVTFSTSSATNSCQLASLVVRGEN